MASGAGMSLSECGMIVSRPTSRTGGVYGSRCDVDRVEYEECCADAEAARDGRMDGSEVVSRPSNLDMSADVVDRTVL